MKKICLVIPSLKVGGMEKVMSELARCFCMSPGLEVHIVLYGREPQIFYQVPSNLIIHLPAGKFDPALRTISSLLRLRYLRNEVKKIDPDTILSFGEYWNSFVLMSLLGTSYPVFISDRCSPEKKFSRIHSVLRKLIYPRAEGLIAQTDIAQKIYSSQLHLKNIIVIPNPIREFHYDRYISRENIVLTVGRLINTKNHDRLFKIFSELKAPDWRLLVIGDDESHQSNFLRLKKLIKDLEMEGRIILEGRRTNLDAYYQRSKIFAFTSSSEGFPNVIGEALSAGLPVVTYNCVAGPSDLIQDNINGFLVPVFDDNLFREKLQLIINDNELQGTMSEKAKESSRKLNSEMIGKKYLNFILSQGRT